MPGLDNRLQTLYNPGMKITVNGNQIEVADGLSVAGLLASLEMSEARVAVEHNRRILQRNEYATAALTDGDTLEILGFVGGG